jgi:predicted dehydrogenase
MKVLLLGGGRMGQRHLNGILEHASSVSLIEPKQEAKDICRAIVSDYAGINYTDYYSIEDLTSPLQYDLAILSGTAVGRLEQFSSLVGLGIKTFLIEKPLEQSRARTHEILELAVKSDVKVWSNHYRRCLDAYSKLRDLKQPLIISVTSGAMGLGCNGIHWIDFALYLTGQQKGTLLFGEVDEMAIGSGRGPGFRDYGGRAIYGFPDGSRLFISSTASSSAPTVFSILSSNQHWVVDQDADKAILHQKLEDPSQPTFLYGKDYVSNEIEGVESVKLADITSKFISDLKEGNNPLLPTLEMVAPGYEMLFDLLETTGEKEFLFT